ncbi:MAG: hypothetical protein IAA85_04720 [Firmicutes bacterium]|nr:hypothetical protein [Candidatus Alectryobacillus merdavium]
MIIKEQQTMNFIYKTISAFTLLLLIFTCISCNRSNKEKYEIKNIAEKHASTLDITQLIDALLLYTNNDTNKICYALVMPKQTLIRLTQQQTYPKDFTLEKTRELFVNINIYGSAFLDSCVNDKEDKKNWLINNSINEPINPIWEQITKEQ